VILGVRRQKSNVQPDRRVRLRPFSSRYQLAPYDLVTGGKLPRVTYLR
jgi:hypothetical protein